MTSDQNEPDDPIGFSIFERCEECYFYVENSCLISDSPGSALRPVQSSDWEIDECQVVAVALPAILEDFGVSGGSFAMEPAAFARFKQQADRQNIEFEERVYENFEPLMLVQVSRSSMKP